LNVGFASGKPGLMPTNYILEYHIQNGEKVKMTCGETESGCSPSSLSPPGMLRFFFGLAPDFTGDQGSYPEARASHAVDFFNFLLEAFPRLKKKYKLKYIEPWARESTQVKEFYAGFAPATHANLVSTVLRSGQRPLRLLPVSGTVDCQSGGIIVHH